MFKIKRSPYITSFRRLTLGILLVSALVMLSTVVVPFFAYGLHTKSAVAVAGGSYDPKGYGIYSIPLVYMSSIVSIIVSYIFGLVFIPLNSIFLTIGWKGMSAIERRASAGILLLSSVILAIILSPAGDLTIRWLLD